MTENKKGFMGEIKDKIVKESKNLKVGAESVIDSFKQSDIGDKVSDGADKIMKETGNVLKQTGDKLNDRVNLKKKIDDLEEENESLKDLVKVLDKSNRRHYNRLVDEDKRVNYVEEKEKPEKEIELDDVVKEEVEDIVDEVEDIVDEVEDKVEEAKEDEPTEEDLKSKKADDVISL